MNIMKKILKNLNTEVFLRNCYIVADHIANNYTKSKIQNIPDQSIFKKSVVQPKNNRNQYEN